MPKDNDYKKIKSVKPLSDEDTIFMLLDDIKQLKKKIKKKEDRIIQLMVI